MGRALEKAEVREFIRRRAAAIKDLPWSELDRYGSQTEEFAAESGRPYRVVSRAFWDLGDRPWESDMEVTVAAYAPSGWRRWLPYRASEVRGGPPNEPRPEMTRTSSQPP